MLLVYIFYHLIYQLHFFYNKITIFMMESLVLLMWSLPLNSGLATYLLLSGQNCQILIQIDVFYQNSFGSKENGLHAKNYST